MSLRKKNRIIKYINTLELGGWVGTNCNFSGLSVLSKESKTTEDFLFCVNNTDIQVMVTAKTKLNGIKELKRNHGVHITGKLNSVGRGFGSDVYIEANEIIFTAPRPKFIDYLDGVANENN